MQVGYLPHSFDMLNVSDLDLIEQANRHCARLVVGVFSDELVERLHGRRPVVPLNERLALVSHLRGVHESTVHDHEVDQAPAGARVFRAADDPVLPVTDDAWLLVPTRRTASPLLRAALRSGLRDDVA